MTSTVLFGLLGAGAGLGAWLILTGWRGTPPGPRWWRLRRHRPRDRRRLAMAAAAGVAGGVVTGWVVGAVLITVAAWSLPRLLAREKDHARHLARVEAVATWAEMLRDTLAAAGLEQAILASAALAPDDIHAEVTTLAMRLEAGHHLAPSLDKLADDLADPTADLVISALRLAATQHARNISELLGSLAAAAREQASMRQRIAASRARTRTSVRIIVGTTCAFAAALILLNRDYVSAYDTLTGQLVLLGIGAAFAVGFAGLARIAAVTQPARFLTVENGRPS